MHVAIDVVADLADAFEREVLRSGSRLAKRRTWPLSVCVQSIEAPLRARMEPYGAFASRRRRLAISCWWPGAEWLADLPLVTEWVDDPAESPAVLVAEG
jgi:hypothetical protein